MPRPGVLSLDLQRLQMLLRDIHFHSMGSFGVRFLDYRNAHLLRELLSDAFFVIDLVCYGSAWI